jgi:hypothetical protein
MLKNPEIRFGNQMLIFVFNILVILWQKFLFMKETGSLTCHKSLTNLLYNLRVRIKLIILVMIATDCISGYKSTIRSWPQQVPYSIQDQDLSLQKIILNPCLIQIVYLQLDCIWPLYDPICLYILAGQTK